MVTKSLPPFDCWPTPPNTIVIVCGPTTLVKSTEKLPTCRGKRPCPAPGDNDPGPKPAIPLTVISGNSLDIESRNVGRPREEGLNGYACISLPSIHLARPAFALMTSVGVNVRV